MDVLLSFPIISYFFSTSLTSWSTSLNLVFFYMTWSTLVLSHSPLKIEIVAVTALRIALWLVPSLIFLAFDSLLPSLSETVKYKGASGPPPRNTKVLTKLVSLALFNLALETALEAAISLGLSTLLRNPVFRTSTTLPLPWQMAKQITLLFTARELLTYTAHRFLLHATRPSKSTRRITKTLTTLHLHHAHPSSSPAYLSSLLTKTDHPVPHLLHRFLPTYLPALFLSLYPPHRVHLLTYLLFTALTTLSDTLATCGYIPMPGSSILLGGVTRRTARHYSSRGKGNFGTWGLLDWACGTNVVGGEDVVGDLKGEVGRRRGGRNKGRKGGGLKG